jgi:hypothetical protein
MALKFDPILGALRTSDEGAEGPQGPAGPAGSDATVTKGAVEAVLTGEISTHSHAGGGGLSHSQILTRTLGA